MIYEFSHFSTPDGRRVRFRIDRAEFARVRRAGFLEGETFSGIVIDETSSPAEVELTMTPAAARAMIDVLAMVGGDAAVAGRMLSFALEDMVAELRTGRAVDALTRPSRLERSTRELAARTG
jgi:hypothetical protein